MGGNDEIDLTANDSSPPNGGAGVDPPPMTMEATTPSVPRNTLDDSESDVDIACSTDLKSLRLKLDAASTVENKKKVMDTITTANPFHLEYFRTL